MILQEHLAIINIPIKGTFDIFGQQKNKRKNRYLDYPCWDVSRVVLKSNKRSDYINANYVSGFNRVNKFIATQEPMATTFDDFWNMIWQEDSNIIVMLNGTKKKSQLTSMQYFPTNQDHTILKEFIIKEESKRMEAHYNYTALTLYHRSTGKSRIIHHFKYLDWPKDSVPDVKLFINFLLIVNKQDHHYFKQALLTHKFLPGPIVVHGDAGIGRTMAYCIADTCLYNIIRTGSISVPLVTLTARQERRFSISTLNHYIFLNNVVLYFLVTIKSNTGMFFEFRSHLTTTDAYLFS